MSIDEDSAIFLMDALGKLYSRPARAVLREYLSNAIDAHRAKGGKLPPIQVTVPARDNDKTSIVVRDFGHGMSEHEIISILSRYGASTKRSSNKLMGGFGLGAKSGFALSNEFFITSFQEGMKVRYRLFKDSQNKGYVNAVERTSTVEPDGLLVEVPVPSGNRSEVYPTAIDNAEFYLGYNLDEIEFNIPVGLSVFNADAYTPLELGEETVGWISKTRSISKRIFIVIGNTSYSVNTESFTSQLTTAMQGDCLELFISLNDLLDFQCNHVVNVPIGSLDLPSSREEISYTERSIKTLLSIFTKYAVLVNQNVQKELNERETRKEALEYLSVLEDRHYSRIHQLTWRGTPLAANMFKETDMVYYRISPRNGKNRRVVTQESGNSMREFKSILKLQNRSIYDNGIYVLRASSEKELVEAKELLTDEVLQTYLDSVNTSVNNDKAVLILCKEDDILNDWIFEGEPVNVGSLNAIADKLAIQQEFHRQAQIRQARLEEERKQKYIDDSKTRNEGLLSYFLLDSKTETLIRRDKDNISILERPVYYWSKEEIFSFAKTSQSNLKEDHKLLFPFTLNDTAPNLYEVFTDWQYHPPANYMVNLLLFLRLFISFDSQIVVLGDEKNLAQFKLEHPDIKSGVLAVKDAVAEDLAKDIPFAIDVFNVVSSNRKNPEFGSLKSLTSFLSGLTDEEKKGKLNDDIQLVADRLEALGVVFDNESQWLTLPFRNYINCFTEIDIQQMKFSFLMDVKKLGEKYPLLMEGTFRNHSDELKQDMFLYLNMKSRNL